MSRELVDIATTLRGDLDVSVGAEKTVVAPAELARGELVGRYVILTRVGEGGMGVVYAAYDPDLDRKLAVKLLQSSRDNDDAARARLLREAQAMAQLAHPNVVAVHDVGALHGRVWIAMEFVAGRSLKTWLAEGPKRWRDVLRVFLDAGEGLRAAHSANLVHRDFKPDNVMLGDDGRVRVMDFGLARSERGPVDPADSDASILGLRNALAPMVTQDGAVVGTPLYMAPEQWEGGETDGRTDQFAFCVALWEALYRVAPFPCGNLLELRSAVIHGELRKPPDARVPAWLRSALTRGLHPVPDQRFPSMAELLAALRRGQARSHGQRLLLAGAAVALAVVSAGGGQLIERAQRRLHADLQDRLHEVRTHAAEVIGDVIRTRAGLLTDYDPLVRGSRRLEQLYSELERRAGEVTGPRVADIHLGLTDRRDAIVQAVALIERFKGRHAILRNSSLYFPVLVAQTASAFPELDEQLITVLRELLRFGATASDDLLVEVRAVLDDLASAPVGPDQRGDLERLIRHAEVILAHRVEVDRIVRELSALHDDPTYEPLAELIRANDVATIGPDSLGRWAVVLTACGVLGGLGGWLLFRRRRFRP